MHDLNVTTMIVCTVYLLIVYSVPAKDRARVLGRMPAPWGRGR